MIKASDRIKIITEWILSSPEYNALSGLRDNIRQLIINQADSVLTDEEREYINVYGWDKTKEQDSIDSDFFDYFNEKEKLKSIPYDSCCNNYGAATTIYDGNKLPILELEVRGNPKLELGEIIQVDSDKYNLHYTGLLIKQTFDYDGSLKGTMTLLNISILREV